MASGFGYSGSEDLLYGPPVVSEFILRAIIDHSLPFALRSSPMLCLLAGLPENDPKSCATQYFDYFECLHHTKEQARAKAVEQEFLRKAQAIAKEGRKTADVLADGAIVGLGIIQQAQEDGKKS
ncbi:hypothetical protein D9756_006709 [Leucocoprinus leucothites]|uniref:Uncharacterized protein n=1 Tax=Leucocoprinus leucothites TaxID=201217 RepID=A0A8H5G1X1_9AGAR|nr:hypothetical protein D9756_006709 [Leucoagaricus leucothites]